MSIADGLKVAFDIHLAGDLERAEAFYREILRVSPGNPMAATLLGLIRSQRAMTRQSKHKTLALLRGLGFRPATVIDVGAQTGTPPLYEVFPDAHHLLIEPVVENEPALQRLCAQLSSAEYRIAAAGRRSGTGALAVTADRLYSSLVQVDDQTRPEDTLREVPVVPLDVLCAERGCAGPFLVKIDVDGLELEVLAGAATLMTPDNVFVIEATVGDAAPRLAPIINAMAPFGFQVWDIVDSLYRPDNERLWQVDLVMVHRDGPYAPTP
ncbi:FkbM family methyltransferase [Azospirillum sp. TSO35-2]|uniref:FkbM family methyltransferase n=1 Tax=Azospirillum sp. TSO35-2 TaxID=716796 RepID=UPI000D65386F|nr:FkbM family methyltransferase [Azospirillum sp. TSO35-2]